MRNVSGDRRLQARRTVALGGREWILLTLILLGALVAGLALGSIEHRRRNAPAGFGVSSVDGFGGVHDVRGRRVEEARKSV